MGGVLPFPLHTAAARRVFLLHQTEKPKWVEIEQTNTSMLRGAIYIHPRGTPREESQPALYQGPSRLLNFDSRATHTPQPAYANVYKTAGQKNLAKKVRKETNGDADDHNPQPQGSEKNCSLIPTPLDTRGIVTARAP